MKHSILYIFILFVFAGCNLSDSKDVSRVAIAKAGNKISADGEGYLHQIFEWSAQNNGKFAELLATMKDLELFASTQIKKMDGGRFELRVKPQGKSHLSSLADVGFGISQFLPIIVADLQLPEC